MSKAMTDKIESAIKLCENVDFDMYGEPDQLSYYREVAEKCIADGKSEAEVLEALGGEIEYAFAMECEASGIGCKIYEKDIYDEAYLTFSVTEDGLKLELCCADVDYEIKNGDEVKGIIDNAIDEAREEYEAEQDEDYEYDD